MRARWAALVLWPLLLLHALPLPEEARRAPEYLAPFVPSPMKVVEAMLRLAKVTPKDVVYDLGCGDGRIVIMAAKKFGARGVGVDIDYNRVREALQNAEREGVSDRVTILLGDAFEADLSDATVVTLYLLTEANLKLRPKLLAELRPGARVVSHSFDMGEWKPDKVVEARDDSGWSHTLYLWVIKPPAPASGTWQWEEGGRTHTLKIRQIGSAISGFYISPQGERFPLEDAFLSGEELHFVVQGPSREVFEGRVEGETIVGQRTGPEGTKQEWRARRYPVRASGTWEVEVKSPWGKVQGVLLLKQTGRDLSGTLEVEGRRFEVKGELFGATARIEAPFPTPLGGAVMRLEGLVDGETMDGPVRVEPFRVKGWFAGRRRG